MAKVAERLRAEEFRKKGYSVRDIAAELGVSRASASVWCREVSLTKKQKVVLHRRMIEGKHRGRLLGSRTNHLRKLATIDAYKKKGVEYFGLLSLREFMLVGAAIYWGEGSKKSRLNIINSDADMILFMYRWFQIALGIPKVDFMPRIFINALHIRQGQNN
jgi:Putative ATPase subunit of terminase (gpP-like)